jgi:hypothetical protein
MPLDAEMSPVLGEKRRPSSISAPTAPSHHILTVRLLFIFNVVWLAANCLFSIRLALKQNAVSLNTSPSVQAQVPTRQNNEPIKLPLHSDASQKPADVPVPPPALPTTSMFSMYTAHIEGLYRNPETAKQASAFFSALVGERYRDFLKSIDLPNDKKEMLLAALAEKTLRSMDAHSLSNAASLPAETQNLLPGNDDLAKQLVSILGAADFERLKSFQKTLPTRDLVNTINHKMADDGVVLTSNERETLISQIKNQRLDVQGLSQINAAGVSADKLKQFLDAAARYEAELTHASVFKGF